MSEWVQWETELGRQEAEREVEAILARRREAQGLAVGGPPVLSLEDELVRELVAIGDELKAFAVATGPLRQRRDEVVAGLRAAGYSWHRLAGLAGTSRQALMERATPEKR